MLFKRISITALLLLPLLAGAQTGEPGREAVAIVQPPASAGAQVTLQMTQWLSQQQNRLAALEDVALAVAALQAALSPQQQQLANQFLMATIPAFKQAGSCPAPEKPAQRKGMSGAGGRSGRGMSGAM